MMMYLYEMKKILGRKGAVAALMTLLGFLTFILISQISYVDWVNEKGDSVKGLAAIHRLREEKSKWNGKLTEDVIAAVIKKNKDIINNPK